MSISRELSVLFIIQAGKRFGIGHLKRALTISKFYTEPFLWIMTDLKNTDELEDLLHNLPHQIISYKNKNGLQDLFHNYHFDLIITDCVLVDKTLVHSLTTLQVPVITLDNDKLGQSSELFIAPLPSYKSKQSNFSQLYHTPIAEEFFLPNQDIKIKKILITLGGSDPNNIAPKILKALKDSSYQITLIVGPLSQYKIEENSNITLIRDMSNISTYIKESDLIFCGPGSTLLEAMAAKKYIVALSHYHHQTKDLSMLDGVYTLSGNFLLSSSKIRNAINKATLGKLELPDQFNFRTWWLNLSDSINQRPACCPLCGSYDKSSLLRNTQETYFLCNMCKSTYIYKINNHITEVDPDILMASNPEQVQQSYKAAILEQREDSNRRVHIIKKILPSPNYHNAYKLLDIGSDYGIFVQEASHNGFSAQGIELSSFARRFSIDNFNITIFDSIEKVYETGSIYNIITIWKKMELLSNPLSYLIKISSLLATNGLIAFRIPIVTQKGFSKGYYRTTAKGGEFLAQRAGFINIQKAKYINNFGIEYIEFYCIRKGHQ